MGEHRVVVTVPSKSEKLVKMAKQKGSNFFPFPQFYLDRLSSFDVRERRKNQQRLQT